jgi:DNA helicase-2/ATP-dependent DNA helicase PcrA
VTGQLELGLAGLTAKDQDRAATRSGRRRPSGGARGAADIARALGRPEPTPEQAAVIEAPLEPMLVVAGAGSGKTETMAARVVWLVANGHVTAEEVLGLTFTRKAAGELADRVRSRLRALYRRGLVDDEPQPVTVSTYHSYAAGVLGDHGLRLGVEPRSRLLGEAAAWQLATEIVDRWDGDMAGVDRAPASVTEAVLALAGECSEHLVATRDVAEAVEEVCERAARLPASGEDPVPGRARPAVRKVIDDLAARRRLLPLVDAYLRRKRELEVLDFGDQVALAARLARDVPEVAAGERERFAVVLLDEYQDTSHAQLVLLRGLFGAGHPVVAVGDPHQSIYGWRGASAGNLQRFPVDFPRGGDAQGPAPTRYLSTSWRNDTAVLAAANALASDLRGPAGGTSQAPVAVPPLAARPGAGQGEVSVAWLATVEDEARFVAECLAEAWHGHARRPTVAVLCRTRAQFPLVEAAVRAKGLPVEVVGLGGLLTQPEVADLRAALEVLSDPTRGDSLMRLLTGPACRIGPRDLDALGTWAAWLADDGADGAGRRRDIRGDVTEERSIVDALDRLPPPDWTGPAGQTLSENGAARLARLASTLRDLRGRTASPLPELVAEVERALLLDVEVAARPGARPAAARAHLDAFADIAAGFAEAQDRPGLGAFLAWLAAADARERGLEAPVTEVREDAVQILTVHAAKGLEWDVVAVTGLVEGTFPAGRNGRPPSTSGGWLSDPGALPYPLRGDAAGLPHWHVDRAVTQDDLLAELEDFRRRCGRHGVAEERRLAYVAVTRARRSLVAAGACWGGGSSPRTPSRFLTELADLPESSLVTWADPPPEGAGNPRDDLPRTASWPSDPLGEDRPRLERAAALVRDAMARPEPEDSPEGPGDPWSREVSLLLAERDGAGRRRAQVFMPVHLSASRLVALARDPDALALTLRRPMPQEPSPQARRGSAFHAWLERRFGSAALLDLDELPGAADDGDGDGELAALQETFLASEWARGTPEAVEVSVETPVAGVIVRGRIDAVFRLGEGRFDLVDWKTGAPPLDPDAARSAAVQLAVYRLAWSRLAGVPLPDVTAAFFYAARGRTVRPVDLLDGDGLERLITNSWSADP